MASFHKNPCSRRSSSLCFYQSGLNDTILLNGGLLNSGTPRSSQQMLPSIYGGFLSHRFAPKSSSISGWHFSNINHPAIWGTPHDYGNRHPTHGKSPWKNRRTPALYPWLQRGFEGLQVPKRQKARVSGFPCEGAELGP